MSRTSNYAQTDIVRKADEKGFDYLGGEHTSADSEHRLRCRHCGGTQTKRSRQIVSSDKGKCIYLPCHPRGKPTLAYLAKHAEKESVTIDMPDISDFASYVITPNDVLTWKKGDQVMKQSWRTVWNRVRKGGPLFLPDRAKGSGRAPYVRIKGRIKASEDAISLVEATQITSWGKLYGQKPDLCKEIMRLNLKDEVFKAKNWSPRAEYSRVSDSALLDLAVKIMAAHHYSAISELEHVESGLVKALRARGLTKALCERVEIPMKNKWVGMSLVELIRHIEAGNFLSSSDWHTREPGASKYARAQGWLNEIWAHMGWGENLDVSGRGWNSIGEMIVANVLILAGVNFIPHVRLPGFVGLKGGQCLCDFHIPEHDVWIEVWGYFADRKRHEEYERSRINKERQYRNRQFTLCSIEGKIIYKTLRLNGVTYRCGRTSFEAHARSRLMGVGVLSA